MKRKQQKKAKQMSVAHSQLSAMEKTDVLPDILGNKLLQWFDINGRDMPWRVKGRAHDNPYAVWISEIMLQQTTVKTVVDYFNRWMKRFPTIESLANAQLEEVLLMWQGLGYYTRAKKIHACAQLLMLEHNGIIPQNREALLKLPGIGPYSASSICAFAFNQPETVVDGNVVRVLARLYGLTHAVTKDEVYALAHMLTPSYAGADYASAIMDLGATVCTPTNPQCGICPWAQYCLAYKHHLTESIPLIEKPVKKIKRGYVYLIQNEAGAYYIEKRAGKRLLSGLYEFPWQDDEENYPLFENNAWQQTAQTVNHTFTHFQLTLKVVRLKITETDIRLSLGEFVLPENFKNYPFSTLMKKVMKYL